MTNKNRASYDASLAHIKAKFKEQHPEANMEQIKLVVSDFEAAILGSMGAAFPWTRPRGCWFHYGQAIFRKAQEYGLQVEYKKKGVVYCIVKELIALALLPHEEVLEAFNVNLLYKVSLL